jgi:hypothetical protein
MKPKVTLTSDGVFVESLLVTSEDDIAELRRTLHSALAKLHAPPPPERANPNCLGLGIDNAPTCSCRLIFEELAK